MEKIRLDILGLSSSQSQMGSFALVLGERQGNRRLPIIIGGFEAQAIALEIESIKPNRPMTHDLILNIARAFQLELKEVIISDLKEGVFYSKLIMFQGDVFHEIDARPSDAIAIGVRYKVPIFVYDFILNEAGIVVKDSEILPTEPEETIPGSGVPDEPASANPPLSKNQMIKKLISQMEEAIAGEDYERAARLRDEIQKLENS